MHGGFIRWIGTIRPWPGKGMLAGEWSRPCEPRARRSPACSPRWVMTPCRSRLWYSAGDPTGRTRSSHGVFTTFGCSLQSRPSRAHAREAGESTGRWTCGVGRLHRAVVALALHRCGTSSGRVGRVTGARTGSRGIHHGRGRSIGGRIPSRRSSQNVPRIGVASGYGYATTTSLRRTQPLYSPRAARTQSAQAARKLCMAVKSVGSFLGGRAR